MRSLVLRLCGFAVVLAAAGACDPAPAETTVPGLAARDTTMTIVRPTRQDLTNRVSLSGKVTINPVFGLVAPVAGQVRYLDIRPPQSTPTKPTRVATVWAKGKAHPVQVPAGAVLAGRLVDDRSTVAAGMPIVSAKHIGYGIVADIDGEKAYQLSDSLPSVQVQIKNGPGPFACGVLGTIAALPAGTVPDEPAPTPNPGSSLGAAFRPPDSGPQPGSEPTGLRVVCRPPDGVRLINGASATLEVVTERATNALVLPVEAVAGGQGRGQVDIVLPDRTRQTREVELGLTDGKVIEIRSGLTGDEEIAVPGPNLPAAVPAQPGPDGPVIRK